MECAAQPFVLLAEQTSCGESPPCTHIQCFIDIKCLLASSVSPVIAGCRSSDHELYCVCPTSSTNFAHPLLDPRIFVNRNATEHLFHELKKTLDKPVVRYRPMETTTASSGGLSGGQVAGIVIGVIAVVLVIILAAWFFLRYMRDRRKNHGEYRPQMEEQHHAKDLPYLQPPAVEGLI